MRIEKQRLELLKLDCTILHLEDDDNDALFFERALQRLKFTGFYHRVWNVQSVIDYLSGAGEFADRKSFPLPDTLVTDSALGNAAGPQTKDLIEWLDQREEFRRIVRIMLTGDMSNGEQLKWIERGIACVLLKGASHDETTKAVGEILRRCP